MAKSKMRQKALVRVRQKKKHEEKNMQTCCYEDDETRRVELK